MGALLHPRVSWTDLGFDGIPVTDALIREATAVAQPDTAVVIGRDAIVGHPTIRGRMPDSSSASDGFDARWFAAVRSSGASESFVVGSPWIVRSTDALLVRWLWLNPGVRRPSEVSRAVGELVSTFVIAARDRGYQVVAFQALDQDVRGRWRSMFGRWINQLDERVGARDEFPPEGAVK